MSKLKKKLKTQGKNSKLKTKTQFFGIFRILRCEKGVQRKACFSSKDANSRQHFLVLLYYLGNVLCTLVFYRIYKLNNKLNFSKSLFTTLHSMMNAKFSLQMLWPCQENKHTIQTQSQQLKPTTVYVCEFKVGLPLV